MINYTASSNFFGFDYAESIAELVGVYEVEANSDPINVSCEIDGMNMSILPAGAYIIRYIEGSYLIMSKSPTFLAIGGEDGLQVGWRNNKFKDWTIVPFLIDSKASNADELYKDLKASSTDNIMKIELTRPHRMQLIPPKQAVGGVKVKIMRFASKMLNHPMKSES